MEQAANAVALRALEERGEGESQLLPQRTLFERGALSDSSHEGSAVSFSVLARGQAVPQLDLDGIRQSIAGMPLEQAGDWMEENLPLDDRPQIELVPDWLGRIPWLPFRIHVFVETRGG
jgi:hypothetical protein